MAEETNTEGTRTFAKRLDFYWQFIAVYSIALIIFSLLKGSIEDGRLSLALDDPPVILLGFFVIYSVVGFLYNLYMNKKLIVGSDFVVFKSRVRQKKYVLGDILKISFGRERKKNLEGAADIRIIKFRFRNRRRVIKIRTSSFLDEQEMVRRIEALRRKLKQ